MQLGDLYRQRWHIELDKSTLGMEVLSCKTPEMNEKEMWVYFLAYNLIRLIMAEAAVYGRIKPRQISFKHALQIWLAWSKQTIPDEKSMQALLIMIARIRVSNRLGRIEPRAIKRRPKPFPLLMKSRAEAREDIVKMVIRKRLSKCHSSLTP